MFDNFQDELKLSREDHFKTRSLEQRERKQLAADIHALTQQDNTSTSIVYISADAELKSRFEARGHVGETLGKDDYDLVTRSGFNKAKKRLLELKPRHLWITPPHLTKHHVSEAQRKHCMRDRTIWNNMVSLCELQKSLGNTFLH